ncbi:MAG TPA: CHRD domain-containing protein [Chitinophagaceae bacterium]
MKQLNKIFASFLSMILTLLCFSISTMATIYPFHNQYSGAQEVPPNGSPAKGTIVGTYNDVTNTISYTIIFSGLTAPTNNAHFHGPAPVGVGAGVAIAHTGFPLGVTSGTYSATNVLTNLQETQLMAGLWYSNIHTVGPLAGGELRAQIQFGDPATISPFRNTYSGTQEVPPNGSPATGTIIGSYNHVTNTISFSIIFAGLTAPTSAAHFHGPGAVGVSAGVAIGHAGFPLGVTSGFYMSSAVLSNLQETQLLGQLWYSNIHSVGPLAGGEIRAQIILTDILPPVVSNPVANPSSLWPPNHKMKNVSVAYTSSDNFPQPVTCVLSVSSNEPVTSADDQTSPDWIVENNQNAQVRAERAGDGNGRIYTITITCTDAQGNATTKTTTVAVAHDQGSLITSNEAALEADVRSSLEIFPNPSRSNFAIRIPGNTSEQINLRIIDVLGRTVESRNDVSANQVIRMGYKLRPGVYYLVMQEGKQVRQVKLIKSN